MATVGSAKSTLVNKIDTLTASATAKDSIYLGKALKEVSNLNNFVWKGAWAASTEYALDDVVSESGNSYICIAAHTSAGTFAVGSNWSAMAIKGTDGVNQTDASNITSGTLPNARISGLPVANISGLGTAATKTVGTGAGNVPVLDASGQIADAQIAGLTASKLSGALPAIDGSSLTNLPAGGKVLQVQTGATATQASTGSSGSWTSSGLSAAITPANAANKILIMVTQWFRGSQNCVTKAGLLRDGTAIGQWMGSGSCDFTIGDTQPHSYSISYLDSPNTVSSITYSTGIQAGNNGTAYAQPYTNNTSYITLIELDYS